MSMLRALVIILGAGVFFTSTLHIPISFLLDVKLYIPLYAISIVLLFFLYASRVDKLSIYFGIYLLLIGISVFLSFFLIPFSDVLLASLSYIFFPVFFFLYISVVGFDAVKKIADLNSYVAIFCGFLACYQLLVDPLLFGIYSGTKYESLSNWGFARASSVFGSVQAYAAYMLFSMILFDCFSEGRRKTLFLILFLFLGGVSGSLGFYLGFILYFCIKNFYKITYKAAALYLFLAVVLLLMRSLINPLDYVEDNSSPYYRVLSYVFSSGQSALNTGNNERVEIWFNTIESNELVVFGNGIGSASTLVSGEDRYNTESYILNLYYEGGLLLLLAFLVLPIKAISTKAPGEEDKKYAFVLTFLFYALIVHVYYLVVLPVVWLILFAFIEFPKENKA